MYKKMARMINRLTMKARDSSKSLFAENYCIARKTINIGSFNIHCIRSAVKNYKIISMRTLV